jgi:hypothetical protein
VVAGGRSRNWEFVPRIPRLAGLGLKECLFESLMIVEVSKCTIGAKSGCSFYNSSG